MNVHTSSPLRGWGGGCTGIGVEGEHAAHPHPLVGGVCGRKRQWRARGTPSPSCGWGGGGGCAGMGVEDEHAAHPHPRVGEGGCAGMCAEGGAEASRVGGKS